MEPIKLSGNFPAYSQFIEVAPVVVARSPRFRSNELVVRRAVSMYGIAPSLLWRKIAIDH
jgi:hypothetical protein